MEWRNRIFENKLSRFLPLPSICQCLGQRMRKPLREKISDFVFEKMWCAGINYLLLPSVEKLALGLIN